jgi:hypothetical protein
MPSETLHFTIWKKRSLVIMLCNTKQEKSDFLYTRPECSTHNIDEFVKSRIHSRLAGFGV